MAKIRRKLLPSPQISYVELEHRGTYIACAPLRRMDGLNARPFLSLDCPDSHASRLCRQVLAPFCSVRSVLPKVVPCVWLGKQLSMRVSATLAAAVT